MEKTTVQYFCDFCGKEESNTYNLTSIAIEGWNTKNRVMCSCCSRVINKTIDSLWKDGPQSTPRSWWASWFHK